MHLLFANQFSFASYSF
jgi:hypothetical protein